MRGTSAARRTERRGAVTAAGTAGAWIPALLLLAVSAARAEPRVTGAVSSGQASIDGTVAVSITSPTLKHWGVPGIEAAFVPDADRSADAQSIRLATGATALCAAIERAARGDHTIATTRVDGDGDFEHRAGDEAQLAFRLVVRLTNTTRGAVWICSAPVVAIMGRGRYPDERFERAGPHRLSWMDRRMSLDPGEHAHLRLSANIDASQW